jgi:hypothetical protein
MKNKLTNGPPGRIRLAVFLLMSIFLLNNPVFAGTIDYEWTLNLSSSNWDLLTTPSYEGLWDGLGVHIDTRGDFIDVGMVDARLEMESSRQQSYTISLPFDIHIEAPDFVQAGQTVFLDSYATLSGTPIFTTYSDIDYSTSLSITTRDVPFIGDNDISVPMENIGAGGISMNFNGSAEYTDTDTSADERLTRTIWREDPWNNALYGENPLNMARATQFEGYELHTSGDVDAWEAEIDLLQFASNFTGGALTPLSAVIDIEVGAGLDIIEENYLQTQFLTGYYTDDGLQTYDDFLINGATQRGWLEIPESLSTGDSYNIQMFGLGLGFSILSEYFLQGNVDFDLELLSLFDIGLGEIDIGSAIKVEDWVTRYQLAEWIAEGLDTAPFLSFTIGGEPTGPEGTKDTLLAEAAQADFLIGQLIEDDADENQLGYGFSYNPQPGPSVITPINPVPEPSTLFLLAAGLLGIAVASKRKFKNYHI